MLRASIVTLMLVGLPVGAAVSQTTPPALPAAVAEPAEPTAKPEPKMICRSELVTGSRARRQTICVPANPERGNGLADADRDDFRKFQDTNGAATGVGQSLIGPG